MQNFFIWMIALGVLLILLGIGVICIPFFVPEAIRTIMAWVFLIAGFFRIVHAFQSRPSPGFWLKISIGVLYELASFLLFTQMMQQYFSLSTILGLTILLKGLLEVMLTYRLPSGTSRSWIFASGVISSGLGALLIANRKLSAAWLLSLLMGAILIGNGIWVIILSLELKRPEEADNG